MGLFGSDDTSIQLIDAKVSDAPISIELVSAAPNTDDSDYIKVEVRVTNNTDRKIDAYMLGFEFFTWFNDYQDHLNGYATGDIKPKKTVNAAWNYLILESSLTGSIVHYPFKVRFKDGEVWKAPVKDIEELVESTFRSAIDIDQEDLKKRRK